MDDLPDLSDLKVQQNAYEPNNNNNDDTNDEGTEGLGDIEAMLNEDLESSMVGAGPASPPLPPPKTQAQIDEEHMLRAILQMYYFKFKDDLSIFASELSGPMLAMQDLDALKSLRNRVDLILGASSATENKRKMFNTCIYVIEKISTNSGFDTTGVSGILANDVVFQKDLMRLSLKWLTTYDTQPEITVPMTIMHSMVQRNAAIEIQKEAMRLKEALGQTTESAKVTQVLPNPSPIAPNTQNDASQGAPVALDSISNAKTFPIVAKVETINTAFSDL
jgi:hypothetical protein